MISGKNLEKNQELQEQYQLKIDYDKKFIHYESFGTLENPCKQLNKIQMENFPAFDGELREPEYYITTTPKNCENYTSSYKMIMFDSKNEIKR